MSLTSSAGPRPSYRDFAVSVLATQDISPTFRRLTLTGPDLHECGDELLDQRIKLVLVTPEQIGLFADRDDREGAGWYERLCAIPPAQRPTIRTYTLSGVDRRSATVTVDLACRPTHGPASAFAASATGGEPLLILAPDASSPDSSTHGIAWNPGPARDVLLVGDETALPAIRNIVNSLPPDRSGTVVLDLPCPDDAVGLAPRAELEIHVAQRGQWVGDAAAPFVEQWLAHHEASKGTYAWVAGEASWVRDLRRQLLGSGAVTKQQASFTGYWKTAKSGPTTRVGASDRNR